MRSSANYSSRQDVSTSTATVGLPTLTYRRARGDMIETYKLLSGRYDDQASLQLKSKMSSLPSDYKTIGNSRKLEVRRCRYDLRKYSFSNRITNMWNSLPDSVVMADTVNQFKNRLDKHWANYAFLYDYLVNYNGTGSLFVV